MRLILRNLAIRVGVALAITSGGLCLIVLLQRWIEADLDLSRATLAFLAWQLAPFALVALMLTISAISIGGAAVVTLVAAVGTIIAHVIVATSTSSTAGLFFLVSPALVAMPVLIALGLAMVDRYESLDS